MAGTSALSALAACAGGHAEIEIRSGWREPLCLYTATVAEPGERKSAVQQAMIRPILDVERQMTETMMPARMEAEARRQIAVKAMEQEFRSRSQGQYRRGDGERHRRGGRRQHRSTAHSAAGRRRRHTRGGGIAAGRAEGPAGDHQRRGRHLRHHRRPLQRQRPQPGPVAQRPQRRHDPHRPQRPTTGVHSPARADPRPDDPAGGADDHCGATRLSVDADCSHGSCTPCRCRGSGIARSVPLRCPMTSGPPTTPMSRDSRQGWPAGSATPPC